MKSLVIAVILVLFLCLAELFGPKSRNEEKYRSRGWNYKNAYIFLTILKNTENNHGG